MATSLARDLCSRMPTNDLFQTSTGVGHHWRDGYYFPDSTFQSVLTQPLPIELSQPSEIKPEDRFETTNNATHNPKHMASPYKETEFKRAPAHYKVHYLKDHKEKLSKSHWRRPLSPSHQQSETIEEFQNPSPLFVPNRWGMQPQPYLLKDHHINGSTKTGAASTQNQKLAGRTLFPRDKEVIRQLDPYLTTNMKEHRRWQPSELSGIAKKNCPTYWECEEYPKAWGHGQHLNPLPQAAVARERPPMRDHLIFKSATSVRNVPQKLLPVPHSGLKPLYSDSFQVPSDVKAKENFECPVDTPFLQPQAGARTAFSAPKMYKTEYTNIGNEIRAVV